MTFMRKRYKRHSRYIFNSSFDFSRLFSRYCSPILQGNNICNFLLKFNPVAGELELTALILHLSLKWYFAYSCLCGHFSTEDYFVCNWFLCSERFAYTLQYVFFVVLICKFSCLYFSTWKYFHWLKEYKFCKLC